MKKIILKKVTTAFVVAACLLVGVISLVGCTNEDPAAALTKEERTLIWHSEREKPFGYYDYKNLSGEEEMKEIVATKFELLTPKMDNIFHELLTQVPYFANQVEMGRAYEIVASGEQVMVHEQAQFGAVKEVEVTADLTLLYQLDTEKKQVYLAKQTILIRDQSAKETVTLYDQLPAIVKAIAVPLSFGQIEKQVQTFTEEQKGIEETLAQQAVSVVDNAQEMVQKKGLQKSIQVFYDAQGVLREVNIDLTDLTGLVSEK